MGGRYTGSVKSFKGRWGFLTADGVDSDIFLHLKESPAIGTAILRVGEGLEFDLSSGGPNNQARAVNAMRLDGDSGEGYGGSMGTLTGTIRSYRNGWGLLDSPSLDGSLYFGERDNPHLRDGSLAHGDEVTFEIAQNPSDGRKKAVNVQVPMKDQSECVGQRVRGLVMRFQDGWGFATSLRFQGTVLLGRKQVAASGIDLEVGEPVEFEVSASPNGKYEATSITKVGPPRAPLPRAPPPTPVSSPRVAVSNAGSTGFGSLAAVVRSRSRSPYASGQGQFIGQVKTFRHGWGFLVCHQLPGDIYVTMSGSPDLGLPLVPGEAVSFDLVYRNEQTEKNNGATAMNVRRWGAAPQANPTRHVGTLVQFRPPPESWGWLESSTCDSHVFFGLRDNPQLQDVPKVGDTVVFELGFGPKGRSKAVNVAPSMVGQRMLGVIRNVYEGWAFAVGDGISGKVMVGKKALAESGLDSSMFKVGDEIEFEVGMAAKGYEALDIRKL